MQNSGLLFNYSPWFIFLCLIAGAAYSFLLYQKNGPWSKNVNYLLSGLRFLLVSIIAFLLLAPFVKQIKNSVEKPSFVIAIDNSSSMTFNNDSMALRNTLASLSSLKSELEGKDYKVEIVTLNSAQGLQDFDNISFDYQKTDLNNLLKNIQSDYEGRNLAGTVLLTDGIVNQGISPTYVPYNFNIYTIGMGDTVPKTDLNLKNLYFNKIAYQGNKFPIVAEILNTGFAGQEITVRVKKNNQVISSKSTVIKKPNEVTNVEFLLDASETGMQHYIVEVQPKENEFSTENNVRHAYIDVIEGKEKILLVALAPHPDIKAIRSALEKNENYELSIFIPGLQEAKEDKYDLIIFHQVPGAQANERFTKLLNSETPKWFIIGGSSDLNAFNSQNKFLQVIIQRGEKDRVFPGYNDYFGLFKINSEIRSVVGSFPPVIVPFGNFKFPADAEILLFQKVGNVVTDKPLLVIGKENNSKTAVMLGDGMWQWRLQEYAKTGKQEAFDEIVSKTVQYLSAKDDKRKFKVYPINNEFDETEPVVIESEIYNEIFERIYNQNIHLDITSESGEKSSYNYIVTEANSQYKIGGLKEGIYNYTASTTINNTKETSKGAFTVKSVQLESMDLTANHNLLRKLSNDNSGSFYHYANVDQLKNDLVVKEAQGVITSSVEILPIINLKWLFFVLLVLVSIEWFLRKYNGAY